MSELLPRLRAASGPARALDAEVARAHGWTNVLVVSTEAAKMVLVSGVAPGGFFPEEVPRFTGPGLDAAISLLPKPLGWGLNAGTERSVACVDLSSWNWHEAATPALALLCAALAAKRSA